MQIKCVCFGFSCNAIDGKVACSVVLCFQRSLFYKQFLNVCLRIIVRQTITKKYLLHSITPVKEFEAVLLLEILM